MTVKLDKCDLSGYVIILTGGTSGIGKEMARILSGFNPKRLIVPARNKEKGNDLLEYIKSSNGHADNVEIWEMDLVDLQTVKNFANKFINEVGELHMLINNAGIGSEQNIKTRDNLELHFQVNHLASFLLTRMLLDTIKKSVSVQLPGKIVFTSSTAQSFGKIYFDNLNLEKGAHWFRHSYANTKLMNVIISKELGRIVQNENILTYSAHPGVIPTDINITGGSFSHYSFHLFANLFGESLEQGAINILYPAFSPEINKTGKFYHRGYERKPNNLADDQELAKKLWNVSEQLLRDRGMI